MSDKPGEDALVAAFIAVAFGLMGAFAALGYATHALGPASIPIWAIAVWGGMMVFRGPLGKALAHRLTGHDPDGPGELPQEVYGELDDLRARVAELEERVDFSERMLTKGKGEA